MRTKEYYRKEAMGRLYPDQKAQCPCCGDFVPVDDIVKVLETGEVYCEPCFWDDGRGNWDAT